MKAGITYGSEGVSFDQMKVFFGEKIAEPKKNRISFP